MCFTAYFSPFVSKDGLMERAPLSKCPWWSSHNAPSDLTRWFVHCICRSPASCSASLHLWASSTAGSVTPSMTSTKAPWEYTMLVPAYHREQNPCFWSSPQLRPSSVQGFMNQTALNWVHYAPCLYARLNPWEDRNMDTCISGASTKADWEEKLYRMRVTGARLYFRLVSAPLTRCMCILASYFSHVFETIYPALCLSPQVDASMPHKAKHRS
jgi:hypothetical protein